MGKVSSWIYGKLGADGLLHVLCCKLAVDVCELFAPLWAAVAVALLCGLAKEFVWDKRMKRGTFDRKDLLADAAGSLLGIL